MKTALVWVASLVLEGCWLGTHPPPAPPRASVLGLEIETFTAANGLRVVVVSDPHAADMQVTMRYQVGAVDDPADRGGLAHLVEHLMFDKLVDGHSLSARLADIASYFNATTTLDSTVFVTRMQPQRLGEVLAVEAERLNTPCTIDEGEFRRERDVVLNEVREREHGADVQVAIAQALYPEGHPYHRRIGGTPASVGAITREQACAFADQHYAIGGAVLAVSGNVTRAAVESELGKQLARIPRRDSPAQPHVSPPAFTPHKAEVTGPVDDPVLVLAWPMPADARLRAKYRAILSVAAAMAQPGLDGAATVVELGDERAPMIGLAAAAAGTDTYAHLVNAVGDALNEVPTLFEHQQVKELDALGFDSTKHGALFRTYAQLGNADERDPMLAGMVARGNDPKTEVSSLIAGLQDLSRDEAIAISHDHLRYSLATVVVVQPEAGKKSGHRPAISPKLDEREPRRLVVDPSEAARAMAAEVPTTIPGARTRKLANGLEVVLLPITSVPMIDIRLVFRSGTSDEPAGKRGAALLAGRALRWDLRYIKDLLLFETAGGSESVDVESDHTTFAVRGSSNQLDYLFAGLRRWVRDGRYDDGADALLRDIKRAHAVGDEKGAITDAMRAAMFGPDHPYVRAGLLRLADESLVFEDAARYRAAHYTPANATLIVTGAFEPATVDRWIDYLFADWKGTSPARTSPRAAFQPTAIATPADLSQVELSLALPATAGTRASQLVAAEMLSEIAGDVRLQLGASYGMTAHLAEARLSTSYVVGGRIDAAQTAAATKLLADRLARVRGDRTEAARVFVLARRRVLMKLLSLADNAAEIAKRVEDDVDLGRAPLSDLATAAAVRDLKIDQMSDVIAELDLSRAMVAMRGPADDMQRAFDLLGRKPLTIATQVVSEEERKRGLDATAFMHDFRDTMPRELADPLTSSHVPVHFVFSLSIGGALATIDRATSVMRITDSCAGPAINAEIGVGYRRLLRAGVHVGYESLAGTNTLTNDPDITFTAIDTGPFLQYQLSGRFWVGIQGGVRYESDAGSRTGAFFGGTVGADLIAINKGWLGAFGRYELASDTEHGVTTFGVGYRH